MVFLSPRKVFFINGSRLPMKFDCKLSQRSLAAVGRLNGYPSC